MSVVLREYTDEYLISQSKRTDYYGQECRSLLLVPAEARQALWVQANSVCHDVVATPSGLEFRLTGREMHEEIDLLVQNYCNNRRY